jgi:hypothetical protein
MKERVVLAHSSQVTGKEERRRKREDGGLGHSS